MHRKLLAWTLLAAAALAQGDRVIVRPKEIHDVLVNHGIGITTFQRFNGDPLNAGLRWSEEGPTGPLAAGGPPDFPMTSIAYCRWFWETLEPEQGKVRWEILDRALEQARRHNQSLAIRLMPYDQKHPLPEWHRRSGARRANRPEDKDGDIWQPDFSDPLYLKHWGALVAAAGRRYDGHPDLDSVDISSVGYWGEGWSPYMPAFPHQQALIDIYFQAFRQTPLLMNFDQPEALAYGTSKGAGWRLDCWGDLRPGWCHMLDFYPQQMARTGIQDVWRRSPVSLETCGVPGGWKQRGYDIDYILEQALRWHATSINVKSSPIPPEWKSRFDEFQKKLGYRFVLRRLEYDRKAPAGRMMQVNMWWQNVGVAPVYRDYQLAVGLAGPSGAAVFVTPAQVRKWLPGEAVWDGPVYVPEDLKPGNYRFRVALLDPRTRRPAIRLAIEGRQSDGWYDLDAIQIE